MPLGLFYALVILQSLMNESFQDCMDHNVFFNLGVLQIFSKDEKKHP